MNWTTLSAIAIDAAVPTDMAKRVNDLNARVAQLNTDRKRLDERAEQFRNTATEGMDVDELDAGCELQREEFRLLQAELTLRNELDAFWGDYAKAMLLLIDKAHVTLEQAQADTQKRFLKAGYLESPADGSQIGRITLDMIARHPAVYAARLRHTELSDQMHDTARRDANAKALHAARQRLNAIRQRVSALAS